MWSCDAWAQSEASGWGGDGDLYELPADVTRPAVKWLQKSKWYLEAGDDEGHRWRISKAAVGRDFRYTLWRDRKLIKSFDSVLEAKGAADKT